MDVKKLSRGDAVIGAAALLMFIFSFMPYMEADAGRFSIDYNFWARMLFPLAPSIVLLGLAAAALSILSRLQAPRETRILGLTLGQFAVPLGVAVIWNSLFAFMQKRGELDLAFGGVITLLMAIVIGAAIIATPMVPALSAPLLGGGGGAQGAFPGAQGGYGQPGAQQPYGAQPAQPYGAQQPGGFASQPGAAGQPGPAAGGPASGAAAGPAAGGTASAAPFQPYWFAVPDQRPLHDPSSNAQSGTLNPGTWYLAVAQHGQGLMVEVDGNRGVLWAVDGIQRS